MKLIECPRDAMQGLSSFVPTSKKVEYLNQLLKVGFHTLDFGSFVSPKAIPQMKDTEEVLSQLELSDITTKLLAIVANQRGAARALSFPSIHYLGFPLSVSEAFQRRNTQKSIAEALALVREIQQGCTDHGKTLVVYLSMGFGNPYGEEYSPTMLKGFLKQLEEINVSIVSLSDTIGSATPALVEEVFRTLIPQFPTIELGAHLHTKPTEAKAKALAVIKSGCKRIDGAIGGMGGCPMAKDELTGNMPTEVLVELLSGNAEEPVINQTQWNLAKQYQKELF